MAIPQTDLYTRGINDNRFYWTPTNPLVVEVAVTGNATGVISDYLEVTDVVKYELGITPDLGWAIKEDLFNKYSQLNQTQTNSKLFVKSNLSVEEGTLFFDNNNELLYVDLSEEEMRQVFSNEANEFLWAVRGVSSNEVYSHWSPIKRFKPNFAISEVAITIDGPVPEFHSSTFLPIRGTRTPDIDTIFIDGNTGLASFDSFNTWNALKPLTYGINEIVIKGKSTNGRFTDEKKIKVTLLTGNIETRLVPNSFDHHGALIGLDRIVSIEETNESYKTRLKDVFIHPANSTLEGLHNSIARNLNLDYDDYAIVIRPTSIDYRRSDEFYDPLEVAITTNYFVISSPFFNIDKEYKIVDPQDNSVELDYDISSVEDDVKVFTLNNLELNKTLYKIDYSKKKISLSSYIKEIWVSYSRKFKINIEDFNLNNLVDAINDITFNGHQILTATLSSNRLGTESCDGLLRESFNVYGSERYIVNETTNFGHPIRWTDISIFHILDKEYWSRKYNLDGNLLNTSIESYIQLFKDKAHIYWDQTVIGKDEWDIIDEPTADASNLPGFLDQRFGYWRSSQLMYTGRYSSHEAFDMGYFEDTTKSLLKYVGISTSMIHPGIGDNNDLKTVILKPSQKEVLTESSFYRTTINWTVTGQIEDSRFLPQTPYGSLFFSI